MDDKLIEYLDKSGQEYEIFKDKITLSISLLNQIFVERKTAIELSAWLSIIINSCVKRINELLNYVDNKKIRSETIIFLVKLWDKD